jgi:hypothetical protein
MFRVREVLQVRETHLRNVLGARRSDRSARYAVAPPAPETRSSPGTAPRSGDGPPRSRRTRG